MAHGGARRIHRHRLRRGSRSAPEVAGVTPKIVSATLLRPEPTSPAMPRISPARSSNEMSWNTPSRVQILDLEHHVADRHLLLGEHLGDLAADHHADDVVAGDIVGGVGADVLAVAKHRELVGDLEQLVHLVGDVDDAFALRAQTADDLEQMRHLGLGQRRGRLVHDQDVGFVGHGLGDLDHLPVGHGELAHLDAGVDLDIERPKQLFSLAPHGGMIDETEPVPGLAPDPDILGHRHERHQVELLMDHGDALLEGVQGRVQVGFLAAQADRAGVGVVDAGDDLHQRRLAGTVLAHERVDRAGLEAELDVVQRHHAWERFADTLDCQQLVAGCCRGRDRGQCRASHRSSSPKRL